MKLSLFHLLVSCLCVPFLFSSCGTTGGGSSSSSSSNVPVEEMTGYFEETGTIPGHLLKWEDDPSLPGKLLVVVDKKKQMMYVYRGTHRIAYAPISSGRSSGMTPSGYFRIASKDADHHSYYGAFINAAGELRDGDIRKDSARPGERFEPAKMPYFMRVNGAVGIHEGYLPGRPSSHGCIRIPHLMAKNLFEVAPVGTRVIVRDGDWSIHELQKKPSGIFRTVHKPSAPKAGANSASFGKKELVKSEASLEKDAAAMPPVGEQENAPLPSSGADAVTPSSSNGLEGLE
ncbi:L,D-transpeptidase family protein [Akkermansia sp.]|uniref:L,D-transpeptidase family protein n=1 Tax=Akkermansia sp. TaxID=1872421 RepID=UPI0025B7DBFF|nr:L,D-transpeptidase family protein [Akkermansia sp.]MCD8064611.1 L,D-transpeptidase family protein [Akkermansia sp.]